MRRRTSPPRLAWALLGSIGLLAASLACPALARAQTAGTEVAAAEVQRLLSEGQQLERARRWGEALGHYESALKQYPDDHTIAERLTQSRIRFDLARRYADSSFTRSIAEMTTAEALELWLDILARAQALGHVYTPVVDMVAVSLRAKI